MLRSERHQIFGMRINKVSLSPSGSKRWIAENGVDTLSYGHEDAVPRWMRNTAGDFGTVRSTAAALSETRLRGVALCPGEPPSRNVWGQIVQDRLPRFGCRTTEPVHVERPHRVNSPRQKGASAPPGIPVAGEVLPQQRFPLEQQLLLCCYKPPLMRTTTLLHERGKLPP